MFINRIGSEHVFSGMNCQDSGFEIKENDTTYKCVVDGCSEGKHSEVGAKLFCLSLSKDLNLEETGAFDYIQLLESTVIKSLKNFVTVNDILNYSLYTILFCIELHHSFVVFYCGDGFIITQDKNDKIELQAIEDGAEGNYPLYFAYNFVPEAELNGLKHNQVYFRTKIFNKTEYKLVGVASDGVRFIKGSEIEHIFMENLKTQNEVGIKRLINKHSGLFKDDITISF